LSNKILKKNYEKIVILNPSVIKNLIFLGYNFNSVVGIDSFSYNSYKTYFPDSVSIIGDYNNPDVEKIILLKPDLIIIDQSFSISKKLELEKFHIQIYTFSTMNSYEKLKNDLFALIDFFGLKNKFNKSYPDFFKQKESEIHKLAKKLKNKSFILIFWYDNNFMCGGKDNFLSSFLEYFGLKNILHDNGFPNISKEKLLTLDPDIIISASSYIDKNIYKTNIYSNLKAIKNNSIIYFTSEMENQILQPGFDTWDGMINIFNYL